MPTETVSETVDIETMMSTREGDTLGYARVSTSDQNLDAQRARLVEADFTKANLTGASLRKADLRRARLFRAMLKNADLSGAKLRGADLLNADFTGATWVDGKKVCAEGSVGKCQ